MLAEPLLSHAARTPDETAILDDTGAHTYHKLAATATALAQLVRARTVRPHVALMLPASAAFVASFHGILLAGKTVVPINFLLSEREIAHVLADSGVDMVVSAPPLAAKLAAFGMNVLDISALAASPPAVPPGPFVPPTRDPGDMAVLMYTSGTSGLPKGVMLTESNLITDVTACIQHARLQRNHKFLGVIPLFHSFGMTAMMLAPIRLGSPMIYLSRFSAAGAMNAIRQHGVSLLFAVPSMYAAIAHLKNAQPDDFKSIYAMFSGGEPLPSHLREAFQQRFGQMLYEGYGLTETSPVVTLNMPWANHPGSVGRPLPGVEVRIVGDDGQSLPTGESGDVWLRGPMIMKGYYNLPQETSAALTSDGFFKTGDLGRLDADGYLFITGRKKDLIIVAGEKVVPREIEEALAGHPSVAEAAVVGRKDSLRGEVVAAFVILREGCEPTGAEELRAFCTSTGLPAWKIPREIFFEKDLPRSPTGKILKRVLSERVNKP